MKSDPLRVPDFLRHILEASARIETYTRDMSKSDFLANSMAQDAVLRNIEILGEASRNIGLRDPDFATRYPQIPLRDIVAMRNRLSHGYFAIDLDIIWKAVRKDVPALRAVVQQVYHSLPK
jgi:uncharacterized protein with HEPN domain